MKPFEDSAIKAFEQKARSMKGVQKVETQKAQKKAKITVTVIPSDNQNDEVYFKLVTAAEETGLKKGRAYYQGANDNQLVLNLSQKEKQN